MSYDTDFSFDASPMVVSRTGDGGNWSVSVSGPDDMESDQSLILAILHVMRMDGPVHILTKSSSRWVYGLAEDDTFRGLVFPERSEPIQVDDRILRDITVSPAPLTFTVSDHHETPWFRDSYGYMLMYDRRGRYVMMDRDPKVLGTSQKVISGPTELLGALNGIQGS